MIVEHKLFRPSMLDKAYSFFCSILKFIHTTVNPLYETDVYIKYNKTLKCTQLRNLHLYMHCAYCVTHSKMRKLSHSAVHLLD